MQSAFPKLKNTISSFFNFLARILIREGNNKTQIQISRGQQKHIQTGRKKNCQLGVLIVIPILNRFSTVIVQLST